MIVAGPVFGNFIAKRVGVAGAAPAWSRPSGRAGVGATPAPAAGRRAGRRGRHDLLDRDDLGNAGTGRPDDAVDARRRDGPRNPGFWPAVLTVLLPIVLMLARGIGELALDKGNAVRKALDVLGTPPVALLLGVLVAMWTLG